MHTQGRIVLAAMLIVVIGIGEIGDNPRLFAWGLIVCLGVMAHWVNSLQKQIDQLKFSFGKSVTETGSNPEG